MLNYDRAEALFVLLSLTLNIKPFRTSVRKDGRTYTWRIPRNVSAVDLEELVRRKKFTVQIVPLTGGGLGVCASRFPRKFNTRMANLVVQDERHRLWRLEFQRSLSLKEFVKLKPGDLIEAINEHDRPQLYVVAEQLNNYFQTPSSVRAIDLNKQRVVTLAREVVMLNRGPVAMPTEIKTPSCPF